MYEELKLNLEDAYRKYAETVEEYRTCAIKTKEFKRDLEESILMAYKNGYIEGKNQKERDAAEFAFLEPEQITLREMEKDEAEVYLEMQLAEINLNMYKAILRVEEIIAGSVPGGAE